MKFSRYILFTGYSFISCKFQAGSHLLSHTVSSAVPSAAYVLTIVFGMGTGVSHKRITTGKFLIIFLRLIPSSPLRFESVWRILRMPHRPIRKKHSFRQACSCFFLIVHESL